jgi:hypothetical protein
MIPPQLPGPIELAPYLQKLEAHPGSIILVATTLTVVTSQQRKRVKIANKANVRKCRQTPHLSIAGIGGLYQLSLNAHSREVARILDERESALPQKHSDINL